MKRIPVISILLFALVSWSSAQEVHVNSDEEADFSNYKTFYWSPGIGDKEEGKADATRIEEVEKIKEAIQKKMENLGYTLQKDNPDLLVNFYTLVQDSANVTENPEFPDLGYSFWWGPNWYDRGDYWNGWDFWVNGSTNWFYGNPIYDTGVEANTAEMKGGTFFIDIIDNEKHMLVWEGYMTNLPSEGDVVDEVDITEDVSAVLDEFPEEGKDQG